MKKEIWEFTKINFKWLILGAIFIFLYSKGTFDKSSSQPIIIRDTSYILHEYQSPTYTPPVINVLPGKPDVINLPQYQPDTSSIQALRKQFDQLVQKHTSRNTYSDTLKIDSLGYVNVKDTVSENKLTSRSFSYNIREKIITNTITLPYKPRTQLYFGGGFSVPLGTNSPQQFDLGLLLKNKKDMMLGVGGMYDIKNNQFGVRASLYSKIKF